MCMCKFKSCSMVYRLYYIVYYNRITSLRLSDEAWDSFVKEATIETNIIGTGKTHFNGSSLLTLFR